MKKYLIVLISIALQAQHDTKWPHSLCGTYVDTCNPFVIKHYETSRRRFAKLPREPYQLYDCTQKENL